MKWIIFFILSALSNAWSNCEMTNLYDHSESLNVQPILNQGDLNTCYAITLATAYNTQFADKLKLDSFSVAYAHKNRILHWTPRNLDYSLLSFAYSDIKKKGLCESDEAQIKIKFLKQNINYSDSQFFYLLKRYFKYKKWHKKLLLKNPELFFNNLLGKLKKKSSAFEKAWTLSDIKKILIPILDESLNLSFFKWLGKNPFGQCLKYYPHETLISTARGNQSNHEVSSMIQKKLNENRPVMAGYCNRIYSKPNGFDLNTYPRLARGVNPLCRSHYSVLVGSRPKGNSCEFLLRNSMGEKYWAPKEYECLCENVDAKGATFNCKKQTFNENKMKVLGCWIPEKKLLNNLYEISYFAL
jgi:hypothetical protein